MPLRGITGEIVEVRRSDEELSIEWRIPRISVLVSGGFNYYYESPRFSFCDGCWNFRVWPNWVMVPRSTVVQWISLDLRRQDSGAPRTVNVEVEVRELRGRVLEREFYSSDDYWFLGELCSISELREHPRLIPQDVLTITCEMKIPCTARGTISCPDVAIVTDSQCGQIDALSSGNQSLNKQDEAVHNDVTEVLGEESQSSDKEAAAKKIKEDFINLLVSGEDSDITLKVRGKEMRAHKAVLRARSSVFKTMLSHEMIEKESRSVKIEDFDSSTFQDFLHFIYSGDTEYINEKNVCNLYKAADKYDVKELKETCLLVMERKLSVSLFCDVISLALLHDETNLTDSATEFFCRNAQAIVETPSWISFLGSNLIAGNELFIKALSAAKK